MSGQPLLWQEEHGGGAPTLLLLHGLGATGEVWRGMSALAGAWPGALVLVDLPGHGRSGRLPAYSYHAHARQLRPLLAGRAGQPVRWFGTREEAAARYLCSVGLDAALPASVHDLPGLGHNAHVEDPAALWRLVSSASREAGVL